MFNWLSTQNPSKDNLSSAGQERGKAATAIKDKDDAGQGARPHVEAPSQPGLDTDGAGHRGGLPDGLTPHDVVLAHVHNTLRKMQSDDEGTVRPYGSSSDESPVPGAGEDVASAASPNMTAAAANPNNFYDPFSGSLIGVLSPIDQEDGANENDMWGHLAQIRELQSEIAVMHGQMENFGGERPVRMERMPTDDDDDGPEAAKETMKNAKEAEFARLAERFSSRKDSIDAMMGKLDLLSEAVNQFHALRSPTLNFPDSRRPTTDPTNAMGPSKAQRQHSGSAAADSVSTPEVQVTEAPIISEPVPSAPQNPA